MEEPTNGSSSEAILCRWHGSHLSPLHIRGDLSPASLHDCGVVHDLSAIQVSVVVAPHNNENLNLSHCYISSCMLAKQNNQQINESVRIHSKDYFGEKHENVIAI